MSTNQLTYASKVGDARVAEGLPDHRGEPAAFAYDFFATPPADIGPLISAESTIRLDRAPRSLGMKFLIAAAVGLPIFLVLFFIATAQPRASDRDGINTLGIVLGLTGFGLTLLFLRSRIVCSFVGRNGVAQYRARGNRNGSVTGIGFNFNQAAELRAKKVRQHYNGAYVGTYYTYVWTDERGRTLLRLKGKYNDRTKKPKPGVPYYFVRAAEFAWSNFFLDRAGAALKEEGSIPFRVDGNRWLRVGPGFMEFHFGGEPVRVEKTEIAKVTLANGRFNFQHKDAKWLSRAGKYSFDYGNMGNAQVFLFALDKLMGYRWN